MRINTVPPTNNESIKKMDENEYSTTRRSGTTVNWMGMIHLKECVRVVLIRSETMRLK